MKKSTTKSKAATKREAVGAEPVETVAKPVKPRKRQGNVRSLILDLLAGGPMPTTELVAKGKFSAAAAFMHLKALREEGAIAGARQGREVFYSLTGSASAAPAAAAETTAPAKKRGRPAKGKGASKASAPAVDLPASLKQEFEVLKRRLTPIDNVKEKVSVLGQLISSLPASMSRVLTAIRDDLQRLG